MDDRRGPLPRPRRRRLHRGGVLRPSGRSRVAVARPVGWGQSCKGHGIFRDPGGEVASPMECRSGGEAPRALTPGHRPKTGPRSGHRPQVRGHLQPAGQPQSAALTIDQRTRGTDTIAGHLTLTFSRDDNSAAVQSCSALDTWPGASRTAGRSPSSRRRATWASCRTTR